MALAWRGPTGSDASWLFLSKHFSEGSVGNAKRSQRAGRGRRLRRLGSTTRPDGGVGIGFVCHQAVSEKSG